MIIFDFRNPKPPAGGADTTGNVFRRRSSDHRSVYSISISVSTVPLAPYVTPDARRSALFSSSSGVCDAPKTAYAKTTRVSWTLTKCIKAARLERCVACVLRTVLTAVDLSDQSRSSRSAVHGQRPKYDYYQSSPDNNFCYCWYCADD